MSIAIERNAMGLMTYAKLDTFLGPNKNKPPYIRFMFYENGFGEQLAMFNQYSGADNRCDLEILEYIDGVVTTFSALHVHYVKKGDMLFISGSGPAYVYGHGFKIVYRIGQLQSFQWVKECVVFIMGVQISSCKRSSRCLNHPGFVAHQLTRLRDIFLYETTEPDEDFKRSALEENTMAFLAPHPNTSIEADYTFQEWRWVLRSKEYLDVCVKRRAESGLHFLSMALSAQGLNESEPP